MWDFIADYIIRSFGIDKLDTPQGILTCVFVSLTTFLTLCVAFRTVFFIVGFFGKKVTYKEAPKTKKYAFIIPARNEEKVIGNLIKSIREQDYPQELITIYVIADNCSPGDQTAEIAKKLGCRVYERHEPDKQRKGYALNFLFKNIEKDYGIESVDGYFFNDADNVLSKNYVSKMNNAFCATKGDVFTGYIASKNFDKGIIPACHSIDTLRSAICCHRARAIFRVGTCFCGRGSLFKSSVLKDGWNYFTLCEDNEFTMDFVAKDGKIIYVEEAVFYDEQPGTFKIGLRQRMRWTRGTYQAFLKRSWILVKSAFRKPKWEKYDMWLYYFPFGLVTFLLGFFYNISSFCLYLVGSPGYTPEALYLYFMNITIGLIVQAWFTGMLVCIRERKDIYCPWWKTAYYIFFFGVYDLFNIPISILCLFIKVRWKAVPHNDETTMAELEKAKELKDEKN